MKKHIHLDQRTWEAMESCRLGADVSADPAIADLAAEIAANKNLGNIFDCIERLDAKIGAAFHDVNVPSGLAQRILDHLARCGPEIPATAALHEQPNDAAVFGRAAYEPSRPGEKKPLRLILFCGGILSAAALLFVALWMNLPSAEKYSEQIVLDEAIRFFNADAADKEFVLAEKNMLKRFPLSRHIFFSKDIRWREIRGFLGRAGIAYDLPGRDGRRATLFVIEEKVESLGGKPRFNPFTTGGYCSSTWQEGDLLYVLVVQGEPQTYRKYLDLRRGPMA